MGNHHNTNSATFQAFDRFVIQPALALFSENSSFFEGSPQIIQLDEECIEGPVPYFFGNAKAKGVAEINDKFCQNQSLMTFELSCAKKLRSKFVKPMTAVWGSIPLDRGIQVMMTMTIRVRAMMR
jgi:hypothetical protein